MKTQTLLFNITAIAFYLEEANSQCVINAEGLSPGSPCASGDCGQINASDRTNLFPSRIQRLLPVEYCCGMYAEGVLNLKPARINVEKAISRLSPRCFALT